MVVVWVMGGNFMGCDLGIGGGGVVSLGPAQCVRLLVVRPGIFIFFIFFSSLFLFSLAALVVIPIEEGCDLSLCGIFWGKQHFGFVFLFFFFFSSPFLIRLGWQVVCFVFFSIWKGFGLVLRFLLGGRGFSGKLGRSSQKKMKVWVRRGSEETDAAGGGPGDKGKGEKQGVDRSPVPGMVAI